MGSSLLMSIGTRALGAAYQQLNTIGNNIANANTPGYSRQQTIQVTSEGQYTGSGYFGRGVTVQTVTRATNIFLTQQAAAARAGAAADGVRRDMLAQLEQVFGRTAAGLGHAATQLFNAFSDLAAAPADMSARQSVLARAEDIASMTRAYSAQLDMVQANVRNDVDNGVREVNTLAQQVAALNQGIARASVSGHTPNDLLDARDELIRQISERIEVQTIGASDGSVGLFIAGGQNLVLGNQANQLLALRDEYDPFRVQLGIAVAGQQTPLAASAAGGGTLAGLLTFQAVDLAEARNRLGQLTAALAGAANAQQSFGIDLSGGSGAPMFEFAPPVALPARTNAAAGGVFVADVTLAITDASALKASEYRMDNDPANPGQYRITRLSDQQVFSGVSGGDVIDGFSITVGVPAPQPGDRFLLRPSGGAAAGMAMVLGNPAGVAAGSPITAVAALANTGSASVASLSIVGAPAGAYQALSVRFTSASGDYDIVDAGNTVLSSGTWSAGTPIAWDGFELALNGRPANGDAFAITPTVYPAASNGNALAFDRLASRRLVDGQTYTDAYAQVLSDMGARTLGASLAADTSSAVAARASEALAGAVGVNLDEEAAKLIQYQQAYQAAAKVLQTAQSVMDTLLQLGAR